MSDKIKEPEPTTDSRAEGGRLHPVCSHSDVETLTKSGIGIATAMWCKTLGVPYILVAANAIDLERLLVIQCSVEPESFTAEKFMDVKVSRRRNENDHLERITREETPTLQNYAK